MLTAYLIVDGDDTCDMASAPLLIQPALDQSLDTVNEAREEHLQFACRRGRTFSNRRLTNLMAHPQGHSASSSTPARCIWRPAPWAPILSHLVAATSAWATK